MVARYYNDGNKDKWQRLADLKQGRYGHGSLVVGDKILITGGWADVNVTE